jgi:hypothetical protein
MKVLSYKCVAYCFLFYLSLMNYGKDCLNLLCRAKREGYIYFIGMVLCEEFFHLESFDVLYMMVFSCI